MLLVGLDDPDERARNIRMGMGDALGWGASLDEIETRAIRICAVADALPRNRQLGALRLDLLAREAFVAGRPVGLFPREFELLWRLADQAGEALSPIILIGDVWRMTFRPETNSLAVHVSRLRAKLRLAGVDGLIETLPCGSYRLARNTDPPVFFAAPDKLTLDAYLRLGKEQACPTLAGQHRDEPACGVK